MDSESYLSKTTSIQSTTTGNFFRKNFKSFYEKSNKPNCFNMGELKQGKKTY